MFDKPKLMVKDLMEYLESDKGRHNEVISSLQKKKEKDLYAIEANVRFWRLDEAMDAMRHTYTATPPLSGLLSDFPSGQAMQQAANAFNNSFTSTQGA